MVTSIFERRVRTCDGQRESCSRFSICFVLMTAMGLLEAITLAFSMATAGIGQIYVGDVGCRVKPTNDLGPTTVDDFTYKPHFLCLFGTKGSSHESEFSDFTVVPGDLGEALQGANVCCKTDVYLEYAKRGVGCAEADIACGSNVYGEAEGDAVESADDGLAACGEGRDG